MSMKTHSINRLCVSCGLCVVSGVVDIIIDKKRGIYVPVSRNSEVEFSCCPGRGYPIVALATCEDESKWSLELGRYLNVVSARSLNIDFVKNASSGGVASTLARYLVKSKKVDGAIVTSLRYGVDGPRPIPTIAHKDEDFIRAQGSKYCPAPTCALLGEIIDTAKKYVFIGTPCQVAGIRLLQKQDQKWSEVIPYVIGIFCGGYKDLRETDTLIQRAGFDPMSVTRFCYRGDGQPGYMTIEDMYGKTAKLAYPGYAKMTGYTKRWRCRMCVDATAELADISIGDAWIPRFLSSGFAWSAVIVRSCAMQLIINDMAASDELLTSHISLEELISSQRQNIQSKKYRQLARRSLFRLFGCREFPEYDGGYSCEKSSLIFEAKVQLYHSSMYMLERLKLYVPVMKFLTKLLRGAN